MNGELGRVDADPRPSTSLNTLPVSSMAAGWMGPLVMFWLYVWGPLRPFDYPEGDLAPSSVVVLACLIACVSAWWIPSRYFRLFSLERSGRLYELLGVRFFRRFVPDGDFANRARRKKDPAYRMIRGRAGAAAFVERTKRSERGHLVLLLVGLLSVGYASALGWYGWAWYLAIGNVVVNVYPILLQRYTRSRLERLGLRSAQRRPG